MEALNIWLRVPEEKLALISNAIHMLHIGSLMYVVFFFLFISYIIYVNATVVISLSNILYILYRIDDIQDDSKMRRGVPATHLIYGTPVTISSGLYLFALALEEVRKLNNPQAAKIYSEEFSKFQLGQGIYIKYVALL